MTTCRNTSCVRVIQGYARHGLCEPCYRAVEKHLSATTDKAKLRAIADMYERFAWCAREAARRLSSSGCG